VNFLQIFSFFKSPKTKILKAGSLFLHLLLTYKSCGSIITPTTTNLRKTISTVHAKKLLDLIK